MIAVYLGNDDVGNSRDARNCWEGSRRLVETLLADLGYKGRWKLSWIQRASARANARFTVKNVTQYGIKCRIRPGGGDTTWDYYLMPPEGQDKDTIFERLSRATDEPQGGEIAKTITLPNQPYSERLDLAKAHSTPRPQFEIDAEEGKENPVDAPESKPAETAPTAQPLTPDGLLAAVEGLINRTQDKATRKHKLKLVRHEREELQARMRDMQVKLKKLEDEEIDLMAAEETDNVSDDTEAALDRLQQLLSTRKKK